MPRRAKHWYREAEDAWYATVDGRKISLRVRGRQNEAAAWRAFDALLNGRRDPDAGGIHSKVVVTVGEVIGAFLADAADRVGRDTLGRYTAFLTPFAARFGALPADRLTAPLAESYSRKATWNESTRAAFLAVVQRAFYFAERARLVDRTPLLALRRPPIASRAADVMVSAEDYAKLSAVSPPPFRRILTLMFLCGCRPGEAAQITAADVDWSAGTAVVRNHKTKRKGKRRVLYLPPAAVELLRDLAADRPDGPLLVNKFGRPWLRNALGFAMRRACKHAGLPGKVCYGLRHGFATDALAKGLPDAIVAEMLGHSSTTILHKHYSHLATRTKLLTDAAARVR